MAFADLLNQVGIHDYKEFDLQTLSSTQEINYNVLAQTLKDHIADSELRGVTVEEIAQDIRIGMPTFEKIRNGIKVNKNVIGRLFKSGKLFSNTII